MDCLVGWRQARVGELGAGLVGQPELYGGGQRSRRPAKRSPKSARPMASSATDPIRRRFGAAVLVVSARRSVAVAPPPAPPLFPLAAGVPPIATATGALD